MTNVILGGDLRSGSSAFDMPEESCIIFLVALTRRLGELLSNLMVSCCYTIIRIDAVSVGFLSWRRYCNWLASFARFHCAPFRLHFR